jgi:hypothetical protein
MIKTFKEFSLSLTHENPKVLLPYGKMVIITILSWFVKTTSSGWSVLKINKNKASF